MDKRCIICGLPEHYTGIQFDSKGVCNYCNFYQENKGFLEDSERLEEIFRAKMEEAKKNTKAGCLHPAFFPFIIKTYR